jgi:hypothetical protein
MSYTVTDHVVEWQFNDVEDAQWQTWAFIGGGQENWEKCLPGEDHRERLRFRLVKRTAVITDEILAENPVRKGECSICGGKDVEVRTRQEHNWLEEGIPDYQCTDREACDKQYDKITEEEGWMR